MRGSFIHAGWSFKSTKVGGGDGEGGLRVMFFKGTLGGGTREPLESSRGGGRSTEV